MKTGTLSIIQFPLYFTFYVYECFLHCMCSAGIFNVIIIYSVHNATHNDLIILFIIQVSTYINDATYGREGGREGYTFAVIVQTGNYSAQVAQHMRNSR